MRIKIGYIKSTHGLKGDLKISLLYLDYQHLFDNMSKCIINNTEYSIAIKSFSNNMYICNLRNINNIDLAKKLVNSFVEIENIESLNNLDSCMDGEELLLFDVFIDNKLYGKVVDFGNYGSGETIEVELIGKKERQIYLISEDWIEKIDKNQKKVYLKKHY